MFSPIYSLIAKGTIFPKINRRVAINKNFGIHFSGLRKPYVWYDFLDRILMRRKERMKREMYHMKIVIHGSSSSKY